MAVVKLGKPVKSNLGGDNGAMAYIINPAKTDGGRLVSSNYERTRTDHDALAEGMLDDNRRSPKGIRKNSRLAYHIKLSFSPDDPVTPERVHELGVEFARRITGGEYKFVVATHTDRHHLHDHIMVCAASQYGKHLKAELPKDIIDQWRAVSDEICRREGLSVVFNPVVEEQTRKMRGGTTAAGDAETPPARDPERVDEAPMRSANEPEATSRKASGGEPLERRYGMSMEEIYASAKGLGVKDRLRMLIDLTSSERLPLRYGVSPAQQRWYQAQARRLDRLAGEAKALNAAIRWTRLAGGDAAKGLSLLRGKVRESHDELQSAVIALHDAIQQGDPDLVAETRGEMERREALCDRYEDELSAIEREIHTTRDREQTETEQRERQQQHKRGRSI